MTEEDERVQTARYAARETMKLWTAVHADREALLGDILDHITDFLILEWNQWAEATRHAGVSYTESEQFAEEAKSLHPDVLTKKIVQATWDSANATFDTILSRRWQGPILSQVLGGLLQMRDQTKAELLRPALPKLRLVTPEDEPERPSEPKLRKLRRKKRSGPPRDEKGPESS